MQRRRFLAVGSRFAGLGLLTAPLSSLAQMMQMSGMMGGYEQTEVPLLELSLLPARQKLQQPQKLPLQTRANIVTGKLEAAVSEASLASHLRTQVWAYNGQLPGPQIVVNEGDTLAIEFTNSLPQPTTIHWHGLPVPADQDGNPFDPVAPGESREYRFTLPESSAGTYWYHPHAHGLVAKQVSMGLAGTLVVKNKADALADLPEEHWIISDIRLDAQGQIPENTMLDWMNGREGEIVLINGQYQPDIALSGNQRIRIWNACSARYLQLAAKGVKWLLVGSDAGLIEKPQAIENMFLAPGERCEVIALRDAEIESVALMSKYYDRQKMMVRETPQDTLLASLRADINQPTIPENLRQFPARKTPQASQQVAFSEAGMMMHHASGNLQQQMTGMFLINGNVFSMSRTDLTSQQGQTELWTISNASDMDHPFHLHGNPFEIVKRRQADGREIVPAYRAYYDTVNLKAGEQVSLLVRQDLPGKRMFHCHILEHESLGMMGTLDVQEV